jgi:hypothetical protein
LSTGSIQSALLIKTFRASNELYGDVITSSSFDGKTHVENLNTDVYKSDKSYNIYVPRPEPVPPPNECKKKNPYKLSHFSTDYLTFSSISDLYFGPYSICP